MNEEVFKDIENYEGLYQISNQGRVYSVKSKKFLKPFKNNKGYFRIALSKDAKQKFYLVHRLVANAFIENPHNLPQVNHLDENPSNNHVSNLEFCTAKYNINYGTRTIRMLQHPNRGAWKEKTILQFTRQGEFVKEFPSIHEASRQTRINHSNISQCCRGNKKYSHVGGFVWRYKNVG